ncbi:hypothetical protein ACOBV9_18400 (plasmid) [Pseudoalteromonas espejiana]
MCERDLQAWINNYTTASDSASEQIRSKYPLSNARIKVSEKQSEPRAFLFLFCSYNLIFN